MKATLLLHYSKSYIIAIVKSIYLEAEIRMQMALALQEQDFQTCHIQGD